MTNKPDERMLGAVIPVELIEEFDKAVDSLSSKKRYCLEAALKLWITLPVEIQQTLLNRNLSKSAFTKLVRQIVDGRFQTSRHE